MLIINNLDVFYDDVQVLYDINIKIDEGEIVTILGSNGAGKTTIIKTICGLVAIRSGDILYNNGSIKKIPAHKLSAHGLTMVPEGRHLFPAMSVKENILLGAYHIKERKIVNETFDWVLGLFPRMGERLKQQAGTMSGGEQQMCAICRALMSKPKFLMMDEPSLGLAPNIVEMIFKTIKKINRENNLTILVVEQNARLALQIANRGYVIENGHIKFHGEAKSLLESQEVQKAYLGL